MEFNTQKVIKKSETTKYISIGLMIYGLIKLFSFNWPYQFTTSSILGLVQVILFPILGIILLISSLKKIKMINGDFINFKEDVLHIKSRGIEKETHGVDKIKSIKINLDDIIVDYIDGLSLKINLVDYTDTSTRKEIKNNFKNRYSELIK
ncbi:hypothetical protein [uncultured Aquimarina sp.]|uniref:hypothetical protein n=1 Tax=uncultured Aquimarina sp. TaxID=575652 RepID=UPI002639E2A4|nr:hypothetical protein [uncultured Aquimarina sp.]